ncbi:hypothetical protein I7I50_02585 [Histoplasma capsulatum G186AR]|uniref:Uncharacterized protein n=1 Tax=Ajellomyces capsulatus TaxID=5037 RepID=A0A8H8D5Z9_AJECA|nr:hypothetical protein I7I52_00752 [Histoplasma capsulatum]QSS71659.1 hypothetical protein I7I50_02585 [Histoplasma capsulatum G186AR]
MRMVHLRTSDHYMAGNNMAFPLSKVFWNNNMTLYIDLCLLFDFSLLFNLSLMFGSQTHPLLKKKKQI